MRKIKYRIAKLNKLSSVQWACVEANGCFRLYCDRGEGWCIMSVAFGSPDGIISRLDSQLKLFK